ncbi:hypothetical protein N9W34_06610 [Rickettsiales bacterium]|nr:hypothetical protein [Rickettsiales bacterium]
MKNIHLLITLLALQGCYSAPDTIKPSSWIFDMVPKDAPDNFKKGFVDGCKSGLANMTNSTYHAFYEFTQDPILRKDPVYYRTWKDTFTFCRHYAYGTIREADMRQRNANSRPKHLDYIAGGENMFETGVLNFWGLGKGHGSFFKHFGYVGTDPTLKSIDLDFSGDNYFNKGGESHPHMNWNYK